jgi:hypothetical protein
MLIGLAKYMAAPVIIPISNRAPQFIYLKRSDHRGDGIYC